MDYGPFGVRFLFFNTKKERRSIDELLIYFATPSFFQESSWESGFTKISIAVELRRAITVFRTR